MVIVIKFQMEVVSEVVAALSLLAVLALGPLVLPEHSIAEVNNFSQFCSSWLEPCGLKGKQEEPCYLFAWDNN